MATSTVSGTVVLTFGTQAEYDLAVTDMPGIMLAGTVKSPSWNRSKLQLTVLLVNH